MAEKTMNDAEPWLDSAGWLADRLQKAGALEAAEQMRRVLHGPYETGNEAVFAIITAIKNLRPVWSRGLPPPDREAAMQLDPESELWLQKGRHFAQPPRQPSKSQSEGLFTLPYRVVFPHTEEMPE